MFLSQTFKNIGRIREIIGILVKYGFEDVITNTTLRNFVSERRRLTWERQDRLVFEISRYERIRMAAEELGPTFVKLAQVLSNRPDMLPAELIKELEKLQDRVAPFPFEQVKAIIENETGRAIEDVFDDLDERPLASASIGQVHRARLKTGEEVVIKVQRPGVKETIDQDLSILREAVNRADRYLKKQGFLNAQDVVKAFERSMSKELDYNNEARNIIKFRALYKDYKNFYIPKAYKELSTEKILVIEFVRGCKISDIWQLRAWGLSPPKVAENGMDIYLTQIFEYGIFHADPHPGNVLVREDGVICLLDFGMVGTLTQKDKYAFANIFIAIAQRDPRMMAVNMKKLAIEDEINDMQMFVYDLNELIEDFADLDVSESSIAEMTNRLQKIMYDYQIRVPGGVFLIFRAFAILEGIGKTIHPNFNTYDFIKPYGARLLKERFSIKNIYNEVTYRTDQLTTFLNSAPVELRDIMQKVRKGKIHFEVELQGYGYLLKKLDSLTNRLILTFIIITLVLSSTIALLAQFPPEAIGPYGIPYYSIIGLWGAGGLGLILLYATVRRRRYK